MGLRFYHTSADIRGGWQSDGAACLGGMRAVNEATGLVIVRADSAIYGLLIEAGHVTTSPCKIVVNCPTADTVQIKIDSDSAYGTTVTIANGETMIVMCADELQWLKISRMSANALRGKETVRIVTQYNAALGGNNLVTEDASDYTYASVILKNEGAVNYTDVRVFSKSAMLAVRQEAVDSDGDIQTIADEFTAPIGIDFATGWPTTEGAGLTINAGESVGMWIRRSYDSTISARLPLDLVMAYTVSGDVQKAGMHSYVARGQASYAEYELFIAVDPAEPVLTDPPADTAATLAGLQYNVSASTTYNYEVLYRNQFGLVARHWKFDPLIVNSEFEIAAALPSDPEMVDVIQRSDGAVIVAGLYTGAADGTDRADTWRLYVTYDGTNPDPDSDTPIDETMNGNGVLEYVLTAGLDETPVKVIAKVYRSSDGAENVDETIHSTTMDYDFPLGSRPLVTGNLLFAKRAVIQDVQTTYIDVAKNIRWEFDGVNWTLYADTVALFAVGLTAIESYCDFAHDAQTGAASSDDAIEVGTWTEIEKTLWVNVNSQHVMKIDCINKEISCDDRVFGALTDIHDRPAPYTAWPCYAHTVFNAYNPVTDRWVSIASIDSNGVLTCGVDWEDNTV